ncbi:MAG: molybdopterin-dependent oxidoreductase [Desulfobacteraceae bacterium]
MIRRILKINGIEKTVVVDPDTSLAAVLREHLFLTGTKVGCGKGECGACSVILNNKLVRYCIVKMKKVADDSQIITIEGIGTPDNLHPLQHAWIKYNGAQCGFCSPGFIVSAKALLDQNSSPSREEVRDWFQKNHNACRCTGYKPLVDATMEAAAVLQGEKAAENLSFKMPTDGKIWGTKYPRPGALGRVTGTVRYGADMILGMPQDTLHLALAQADVSHANILSIDTAEAKKMPGVFKVITHKDVKGKNRITGLVTFPTNKGDGWDRPILCDKKIFQYGDAYAIVCADTQEHARAAAKKVKIELEELPAYMSAPAAMAPDAMEIHPGTPNVYFTVPIKKGEDTDQFMQSAAFVVEDEFYTQRQPHMPIEPDVGLAYWNDEGVLFIHSKSTALHMHYAMIQEGIGIAPDKLVIANNEAVGGMFGYKLSPTMEALLGVAAIATGKAVALKYDWRQQQTYTGKRSPWWMKLKIAADKNGKLKALESDWTVDHGPYSEFGDMLTIHGAENMFGCYSVPNIRGEGRTVCTNHAWGSAFRAFGAPQSQFATEVLMDELAEKMGLDPFELRYKNVLRPGDTTPTGCEPDVYAMPGLLDMMRPMYEAALERARQESTPEKKRGVGISCGQYNCGGEGPDTAEAWIELTQDGAVAYTSWEDPGQGGDLGTLTTAHETLRPLGIAPENIRLVMNDTSRVPNSGPAGASRAQVVIGQAIKNACEQLLTAMKKPDGSYRTYDEMVKEDIPVRYEGKWSALAQFPDIVETMQGNPYAVQQWCVFLAEVEVESLSGKTKVVKMTYCGDHGVIANQLSVDGQIFGGLSQGIGLALSEDFEDIKKHATMAGAGFPFIKDVPDDLEIHYQQTPRPHGPFGAAGVGEGPLTSPHAAIINAIYNACGVRITQLPAYADKIRAELEAKK